MGGPERILHSSFLACPSISLYFTSFSPLTLVLSPLSFATYPFLFSSLLLPLFSPPPPPLSSSSPSSLLFPLFSPPPPLFSSSLLLPLFSPTSSSSSHPQAVTYLHYY